MAGHTAVDTVPSGVRLDVARREARVNFRAIKAMSTSVDPPRAAVTGLLREGCGVIPEIKQVAHPVSSITDVAHDFEAGGAHLIACHIEPHRHPGALEDMALVRAAVSVPIMARGIIYDPYQVHEARYYGADIIPLKVRYLDDYRLAALADRAESLQMVALAEVRCPQEADRALRAGFTVIGVDTRGKQESGAHTSGPDRFAEVAAGMPATVICVGLSGVGSSRDVIDYAAAGADAVVVHNAVMAAAEPGRSLRVLCAAGQHPACPSRKAATLR